MAARKNANDLKQMTAEERAQYEKRLEQNRAPKPAYLAYKVREDGTLDVALTTRSAEEVLAAVDQDRDLKYQRIMVK